MTLPFFCPTSEREPFLAHFDKVKGTDISHLSSLSLTSCSRLLHLIVLECSSATSSCVRAVAGSLTHWGRMAQFEHSTMAN